LSFFLSVWLYTEKSLKEIVCSVCGKREGQLSINRVIIRLKVSSGSASSNWFLVMGPKPQNPTQSEAIFKKY